MATILTLASSSPRHIRHISLHEHVDGGYDFRSRCTSESCFIFLIFHKREKMSLFPLLLFMLIGFCVITRTHHTQYIWLVWFSFKDWLHRDLLVQEAFPERDSGPVTSASLMRPVCEQDPVPIQMTPSQIFTQITNKKVFNQTTCWHQLQVRKLYKMINQWKRLSL